MKKRIGFLFVLAMLLLIPFILAQEFNPYTQGGYDSPFSMSLGNFSVQAVAASDWFSGAILFCIFLFVYTFLLRGFFKEMAILLAIILAFSSSVGIIVLYGPVFYSLILFIASIISISLNNTWIFWIILLAIMFFLLFKTFKRYGKELPITFLIISILWFAVGKQYLCRMTWMPYRACPVIDTICIIIVVIALLYALWYVFWGRKYQQIERPEAIQRDQSGNFSLAISVSGSGRTNPGAGSYQYKSNKNVTVRAQPNGGATFDRWILDGREMGNPLSLNIIINDNHTLIAEFSGAGGGGGGGGSNPPRIKLFATPNNINAGQTSTLAWATINAVRVDISGGVGRQGPKGRYQVRPNTTTTYTAIAHGGRGNATATVTVTVNGTKEQPQQAKEEKIKIEKRSIYDLQRRYISYTFQLRQVGKNQWRIRRILKALSTIEAQLHRVGASIPSGYQTPDQYEIGLRRDRKIT